MMKSWFLRAWIVAVVAVVAFAALADPNIPDTRNVAPHSVTKTIGEVKINMGATGDNAMSLPWAPNGFYILAVEGDVQVVAWDDEGNRIWPALGDTVKTVRAGTSMGFPAVGEFDLLRLVIQDSTAVEVEVWRS